MNDKTNDERNARRRAAYAAKPLDERTKHSRKYSESLTDEQVAAKKLARQARFDSLTPEQQEAIYSHMRDMSKQWRENRTPAEKRADYLAARERLDNLSDADFEKHLAGRRKAYANRSEEQVKLGVEYQQDYYKNMSDEQRENKRLSNIEYVAGLSAETKRERLEKRRAKYAAITPEQRAERNKQQAERRAKRKLAQ